MLRKMILTLATGAALGAAALAPSTASAHPHGGHGGHWGWFGPGVTVFADPIGYDGCMVRRWVQTPWGPRLRWVNRCY